MSSTWHQRQCPVKFDSFLAAVPQSSTSAAPFSADRRPKRPVHGTRTDRVGVKVNSAERGTRSAHRLASPFIKTLFFFWLSLCRFHVSSFPDAAIADEIFPRGGRSFIFIFTFDSNKKKGREGGLFLDCYSFLFERRRFIGDSRGRSQSRLQFLFGW